MDEPDCAGLRTLCWWRMGCCWRSVYMEGATTHSRLRAAVSEWVIAVESRSCLYSALWNIWRFYYKIIWIWTLILLQKFGMTPFVLCIFFLFSCVYNNWCFAVVGPTLRAAFALTGWIQDRVGMPMNDVRLVPDLYVRFVSGVYIRCCVFANVEDHIVSIVRSFLSIHRMTRYCVTVRLLGWCTVLCCIEYNYSSYRRSFYTDADRRCTTSSYAIVRRHR